MREIKFRAWDKENQDMTYGVDLQYRNNKLCLLRHDNWMGDGEPEENVNWDGNAPVEEFELMQYTGLKDKNGKEIYEGDIVRTHPIPHEFNPVREPCVVQISPYGGVQLYINSQLCAYTVEDSTEVIGNIYENPELLEVKK